MINKSPLSQVIWNNINKVHVLAWLAISLLTSGLGLLPAIITRLLIDEAMPKGRVKDVIMLSTAIILVILLSRAFSYLSYIMKLHFQHRVKVAVQMAILKNSFKTHDVSLGGVSPGDILTAILSDSQQLVPSLFNIADATLQSLASLVAIGFIIWEYAAYLLIPFCVLVVRLPVQRRWATLLGQMTSQQQMWQSRISDDVVDSLSGLLSVKVYSLESKRTSSFYRLLTSRFRDIAALDLRAQLLLNTDAVINSFIPALVYGYGGYLVVTGATTVGTVLALLQLITRSSESLTAFLNIYASLNPLKSYMERIDRLLPSEGEAQADASLDLYSLEHIELREVYYRYPTRTAATLSNISLKISRGDLVGLTGVSGAGKSTIGYLLSGWLPSYCGQFTLNGHDIRDFNIDAYRKRVVYVSDREHIFPGTIRENLLLVNSTPTESQMQDCLYLSMMDEVVAHMPQGLETVIGKNGVALSAGQRQRLFLARAVLFDPQLIILDEITSNLDNRTENALYERMEQWLRQRIVLLIAHRDSTLNWSDTIYRLTPQGLEVISKGA